MLLGGRINKKFLKNHLNKNKYDIIIAVDKGLEVLDLLEIKPNYIIGDFDSIDKEILKKYEELKIEIKKLIPEKDLTDTESALQLAIEMKSKDISIIGAIGTRLDHVISNVHILKQALDKNVQARIINENNEIQLVNKSIIINKDNNHKYISFIPLTTEVIGVTITGMKYCLNNYTFSIGNSLGVSNEQIQDVAEIKIKNGILIMIKSND